MSDERAVWLAAGLRTPFVNVDGVFANRDAVALSVPVAQAMASRVNRGSDQPPSSGPIGMLV